MRLSINRINIGLFSLACSADPAGQTPLQPSAAEDYAAPRGPNGDALDGPSQAGGAADDEARPGGPAHVPPSASGGASAEADASAGETPSRVRSTGPGDWGPGDYPPSLRAQAYLEIGGVAGQAELVRQYKVHVPPSYDPARPTALVFCFHGLMQNAVSFCVEGSGMVGASDEFGHVLVMPNGFENSWNAGTCCGGASARGLDDVALTRALVAELGTHLNIDLDRIYATGFSNGGYLSLRLACEASDLIAAVAPGSGAIGTNENGGGTNAASDFVACEPAQAVSVLAFHGTQDTLVPYGLHLPALAHFADAGGCAITALPATEPFSSGDTSCISHTACPDGVEVTGCTVAGGGHVWFGVPSQTQTRSNLASFRSSPG